MMRSGCICVSLVFALAILTACGGGGSSSGKQTPAPSLSSIAVTPAPVTLVAGQTQQLTATATYSDGSTANVTASTTWSSSNASVATVTSGLLTATTAGQAAITATTSAIKGSSALTVNAKVVTSVSITPQTQTLFLNSTQPFDAVAVYNDGSAQDITTTAQWQSSAPNYATVSNAGIVTAVAAGNVTISATTSGSVSSSANVTVDSSSTGVTMIDDLTDSRLMLYWPGDGSVVTYSGTRNADGTFAAINSTSVTAPPAANQPDQVFTFDSQGRESTATLADGTLIGFNWTANPTMVVIPPNQGGAIVVVPLPATPASRSRKARAASQASSSAPPSVLVNVTTDLGAGPKPEDNALVNVYVAYYFGGNPTEPCGGSSSCTAPIPALETSPGSGQYSLSLASGPSNLSPAILQSSASKELAAICQIPLPAALLCGPEAPACAAAIGALGLVCKAQSYTQFPYTVVNYLNKLIPPNVSAEVRNGCGSYVDATQVSNYGFNVTTICTVATISVTPNPATTSVGGTQFLTAAAMNNNETQIPSSALNWSWAAGSGIPSLQDSYLQITPMGTNAPAGWLGGKFSVAVANVAGQHSTPAGVPDTVTVVETNSNTSGTSAVTVQGALSLTATWTVVGTNYGVGDEGWNGTDTLTITNENWVYTGSLGAEFQGCFGTRTESGSSTGYLEGPFVLPTTPPTPPAPFSFPISLPIGWTNTNGATGCENDGGNGFSYSGGSITPGVTIQATPAPGGGYTLSTSTVYPVNTPYGAAQTTVTASGFLTY